MLPLMKSTTFKFVDGLVEIFYFNSNISQVLRHGNLKNQEEWNWLICNEVVALVQSLR